MLEKYGNREIRELGREMKENYLNYFIFLVIALLHTDCSHTSLTSDIDFDVLLTVHLSIILVINQLNAQILMFC